MASLERNSENVRWRSVWGAGRGSGKRTLAALLCIAVPLMSVTLEETAGAANRSGSRIPGPSHQGRTKRSPKADDGAGASRKGRTHRAPGTADTGGGLPFAIKRSSRVAPNQGGRIAIFPFPGDDGTLSTQVSQLLAARGLEVLTDVKPVDTAEQYRDLATTLHLAAYVEGNLRGTEDKAKAVVRVRSGYSGRKIREVTFKDSLENLPREISDGLWPKLGPSLAHACAEAARPRRKVRGALVINAGTPIETIPAAPKVRKSDEKTDDSSDVSSAGKGKAGPAAERNKTPSADHVADESV